MARAFGSYPKCQGFESLLRYHENQEVIEFSITSFSMPLRLRFHLENAPIETPGAVDDAKKRTVSNSAVFCIEIF